MTWRDKFRPIIAAVIAENAGKPEKELRAALRAAWPANEPRLHWPYKVYLDEIALQLGKRKRADRPRRRIASRTLRKLTVEEAREYMRKRQMPLFDTGGI